MKKIKRLLSFILVLFTVLCSFFGCNDRADGKEETAGVKTSGNYRIIFAESNEYGNEAKQTIRLQSGIREKYGVELEISSDYLENGAEYDSESLEILVGHTGYPQSQSAAERVTKLDYLITADGNKIILIGGIAESLENCVDYFLESCLSIKDGTLMIDVSEEHLKVFAYPHEQTILTVSSLNLRYARNANENNQKYREPRIYSFINTNRPDSFGVQECEKFWRARLIATIGKIGYLPVQEEAYSDNGDYAFKNYIWYNSSTTKLIDGGRIWLSETPDKPSKGFGATNFISAGWAIFENKATGAQYVHINTHLFVGDEKIRGKEAEVLLAKIKEFTDKGYKVFVTGDFNSNTSSDVYKSMTEELLDVRSTAKESTKLNTFNGYSTEDTVIDPSSYQSTDYCFYNEDINVYADKFEVLDKWNGGYMSDHNALLVKFTLYKR